MANYSSEPGCVTILYGSENGTAEDYARYLWQRLQYLQLKPTLSTLDEYPLKSLVTETKILIIVCSTTGQGELPLNARKFMKFLLKKKLPSDLLNHIKLTTFGVGDSSYTKFNYAVKKLHTRLHQLGCSELSPRCEADEMSAEGVDGFYKEWELKVIENIRSYFPDLVTISDDYLLPPLNPASYDELDDLLDELDLSLTRVQNDPDLHIGKIVSNVRLTDSDHFQDVRHVIIESEELKFLPGDTVGLYPINDDKSVELLIQLQPHWIPFADKPLHILGKVAAIDGGLISAEKLTLRSLFKYHLDIVAIPRRSFFMNLWHFTNASTPDGEREQEKLKEFGGFEDTEELYNYANRPRRLILETILEFQDNLEIPIRYIYDLFPKIRPRLFSIASKPSPTQVELVVGIVEYKTMLRRIRRGLCSKWLKLVDSGDRIVFKTHRANLKYTLPSVPNPPLIMIAPGTGIAPMKSIIEHVTGHEIDQQLHLFYGCRYSGKDLLFRELWNTLVDAQKLHFYPAFSRDENSTAKYVQDRLFQEKALIGDLLLNQNAIIFVCGSSGKMPKQVRITLMEVLVHTGMDEAQAGEYLLAMEDSGRYKEDVW
ncbi:NADPH-ferrihemo protein reductase [Suhomyces tanzawaensis NRRL Y-17324]|uniref:NADPH-dependent diflavin oxidoreductase 1 n=1 Tax=Suhomyces tanzawaensis NRRL Y-17324 TaxID=984487 RepID=A0A1E4SLQ6_9ASCO|nr:NADPH-ferrihemo protein reductase [Suhomyces tanzawaensis NRRL Y-17324]ODV80451.1 NADPH-ferrihemo protein reductase [Suhomyces tanzawaensis NRRL Y-17324]